MSDPIFSEQYYFNEQSCDHQIEFSAINEPFQNRNNNPQQLPKITIYDEGDNVQKQMNKNVEDIRMDKLRIKNDSSVEVHPRSGSDCDNSREFSQNDPQNRRQRKNTKEEQKILKEKLQSQIILNLGQTKSTYTNKIQNLVKKESNNQLIITTKTRQSRSQQKLERKNEQQMLNIEHSDQSSSDNQDSINDINMDPNQLKQVRNRESARNSRARKKIYFELLETRVQELQDENDKLREQCSNLQKSIEHYNKQQDKFQQFIEQQRKLFEKLDECLQQGKDASDLEILLDALKYRTSSNKQERIDAAKSYSYSILDVCLPLQTKYLFSILEDKDFFSQSQKNYSECLKDLFKKIDIKFEQYQLLDKIKSKLIQSKLNIQDSFKKIKNEIKQIQSEAGKIDLQWEQLKENLDPLILAQCLLTLHKNEFRAEFQASTIFKKNKEKNNVNMMQIEIPQCQRKQVKKCN